MTLFRPIIQAHNNLPQRVLAKGGYPRRCLSSFYALLLIHLLLVLFFSCFNYAYCRSVSGYIAVVQLYVCNMIYMREINAKLQSPARLYLRRSYLVVKRDEISLEIEISRSYNLALGGPGETSSHIYMHIYMHRDCKLGIEIEISTESPYMRSRGD